MIFWRTLKQWIWPDNFWKDLTKGKYVKRGIYQGQVLMINHYQKKAAKKK